MRHHLGGVTVITVGGELDLVSAGELETFVRRAHRPGDQVVVDLTKVGFMDCSGLRALLRVPREVRADGGVIRLAAPQPIPARVLKLTGADRCVPVHASREEALEAALTAREPTASRSSGPDRIERA